MGRVHLFELEDQSWFPKTIRDSGTDYMRFVVDVTKPYRAIVPRLRRILELTESPAIIDLCSGGAGPIVDLREQLDEAGCQVPATLTDKFPNRAAFDNAKRLSKCGVDFIEESIDAAAVPPNLKGFRTLFSGLHHFRPKAAKSILQDAVDRRQPIGVFEIAQRSLLYITGTALVPLALFVSTPFVRPFRWSRLFWTYVIPVIPVFLTWDAFVSCLRIYSPQELRELVTDLSCEDYIWEIGIQPAWPFPVSYLIGYPK